MFADKFADLANFAATALVFSQAVGSGQMSWFAVALGVGSWVSLMSVAYALGPGTPAND